MNLKDFQDKCFAYNPKYPMFYERIGPQEYVYFHDGTLKNMFTSQGNSLYIDKFREALVVWCDGTILKDKAGILTTSGFINSINGVSSAVSSHAPLANTYPGYYTVGGGGSGGSSSPNGGNGGQYNYAVDYDDVGGLVYGKFKAISKCECGAHKVNSTNHSSWCPIKESNV